MTAAPRTRLQSERTWSVRGIARRLASGDADCLEAGEDDDTGYPMSPSRW